MALGNEGTDEGPFLVGQGMSIGHFLIKAYLSQHPLLVNRCLLGLGATYFIRLAARWATVILQAAGLACANVEGVLY